MDFHMGEYGRPQGSKTEKTLLPLGTGTILLVQIIINFLIETQDILKCLGIKNS